MRLRIFGYCYCLLCPCRLFEGIDFLEAGAAGGVAADEGLEDGGVGLGLDDGVADDFGYGFCSVGVLYGVGVYFTGTALWD